MSGNLAPLPIWQFVDQNGHPIAGGSVAWYQAGTQNKVTVYSDIALDTPLPNPVPLDSAGRPTTPSGPTEMWFDPSRAYKQVLTDAQGQVVWTADNIVSPGTGIQGPPGPPGAGMINGNYNEGTWTPSLIGTDGNAGSATYATQSGYWSRVGRLVFVTGRLILSAKGTWGGGALAISGLPYQVQAAEGSHPGWDVGHISVALFGNLATPWIDIFGGAIANPSSFALEGRFSADTHVEWINESHLTDTTDLSFSGFYQTSDQVGDGGMPGTEQIVISNSGIQPITLSPGACQHLVYCSNTQPLSLSTVTVTGGGQPQAGERLVIMAMGTTNDQVVYIQPAESVPDSTFVNELASGPLPLSRGVAEYVFAPLWGNRWRLISHRQHFAIATGFAAGQYRALEAGNAWVVDQSNVVNQEYEVSGSRLRFWFELANTQFSGIAGTRGDLLISRYIWGSYLPKVVSQNAGLVGIIDGDPANGWGNPDQLCIGWAQLWDNDNLVISNLTRPFHGPIISINGSFEFEIQ